MNHPSYFEIQATDVAKARSFYEKVFGWKFVKDESLPVEYYRITTDGMMGGLLKRPAEVPPKQSGTNAFTVSMQVKNFDETAKIILGSGGIEVMPKFAVPGKCWQGYFLDSENNVFGIFEEDENAK